MSIIKEATVKVVNPKFRYFYLQKDKILSLDSNKIVLKRWKSLVRRPLLSHNKLLLQIHKLEDPNQITSHKCLNKINSHFPIHPWSSRSLSKTSLRHLLDLICRVYLRNRAIFHHYQVNNQPTSLLYLDNNHLRWLKTNRSSPSRWWMT